MVARTRLNVYVICTMPVVIFVGADVTRQYESVCCYSGNATLSSHCIVVELKIFHTAVIKNTY
jgi:hypothetical protein